MFFNAKIEPTGCLYDSFFSYSDSIRANEERLKAIRNEFLRTKGTLPDYEKALRQEALEIDHLIKQAHLQIGNYNNLSSIGNYYGSLSQHKPKNSLISRIIKLLKDIWNGN